MSLSRSLQKVASRVVSKFGADVVVRYISPGGYNPATGSIRTDNTTDVTVRAVLETVDLENVNEFVQAGDKRLIVAAADLPSAPTPKDVVLIRTVVHQIVQVDTTEPSQEAVVYEMILRA